LKEESSRVVARRWQVMQIQAQLLINDRDQWDGSVVKRTMRAYEAAGRKTYKKIERG